MMMFPCAAVALGRAAAAKGRFGSTSAGAMINKRRPLHLSWRKVLAYFRCSAA